MRAKYAGVAWLNGKGGTEKMSLVDLSAEEVAGKNGFDDCSAQKMNKMTPKKATIGPWKNQLDDFRRDAKNRWKPLETQTFDGLSIEF